MYICATFYVYHLCLICDWMSRSSVCVLMCGPVYQFMYCNKLKIHNLISVSTINILYMLIDVQVTMRINSSVSDALFTYLGIFKNLSNLSKPRPYPSFMPFTYTQMDFFPLKTNLFKNSTKIFENSGLTFVFSCKRRTCTRFNAGLGSGVMQTHR